MGICYYKLNPIFALRSYSDMPFALIRYGEVWFAPISASFFTFLLCCDGVTPFDSEQMTEGEKDAADRCLNRQVILQSDTPDPIAPYQKYRNFDHTRKYITQWSITNRCNLRCKHCFVMSMDAKKAYHEYTLPEIDHIIRQLSAYGIETVMLTGGEPLLHPHFLDIVQKILNAGMIVDWINTNGMLLTEEMLDRLTAMGVKPKIAISFDGFGTHDWMRNCPGAEDKALRAIRLCGEKKAALRVCINVNRKTLHGMVSTVREMVKLGTTEVFLLRTTEVPRWVSTLKEEPDLNLGLEDFIALIPGTTKELLPEIRNGLLVKYFGIINVSKDLTPQSLTGTFRSDPKDCSAWCSKTHLGFFISSDGFVIPCDGAEGAMRDNGLLTDEMNILHNDLGHILHSASVDAFKMSCTAEDILQNAAQCRDCEYWSSCYGGKCRVCSMLDGVRERGFYCDSDALRRDVGTCIFIRGGYRQQLADVLAEL